MFTRSHSLVLGSVAIGLCLAASTLFLAAGAAYGATWPNVTVTTVDGREYPAMTVEATAGAPAILLINAEGGRKSMSRASIRSIVDSAGLDVTEWVFAGEEPDRASPSGDEVNASPADSEFVRPPVAAPEPEIARTPDRWRRPRRATTSASPQRVLVLPSLSVGAAGSSGDTYAGFQEGGSLGFGLRITAIRNTYIGFDYRRQWLGVDYRYPVYDYGYRSDTHQDELYFIFGAHPQRMRLDRPIPFVEAGVGAIFRNNDGGAIVVPASNVIYPRFVDDTVFGVLLAGGVILPLSPGVPGVGVHVGANIRVTGGNGDYGGSSGTLFGATAGFIFLLGDAR